jgi:hypothetical protein
MADQTAQELIKMALRVIGVTAAGETPPDNEMQDALAAMKVMFRSWASKGMVIYTTEIDTHTLSAGTVSYTIGSAGTINTTRPQSIRSAFVTSSGLDYPLNIISEEEYTAIAIKDQGDNYPSDLWYKPEYPLGVIYLYPPGGGVLTLHSIKQLSEPSALTTSIAFPGEYDAAIKWNLAEQMCPEYGKEPSPYIMKMAEDSLDDVINFNASLNIGAVKTEILQLTRRWHINEG